MTFEQIVVVAILLGMLAVYATERFRVELVAMAGLAIGFASGVVPLRSVFAGFSSPAVITVIEILLVVAALGRTRVIDSFARQIVDKTKSERGVLAVVCLTGAGVSVFMNNIGALALLFPVALSVCARLKISPARMLMPLSFATLLGGMCSLTGTPANLVVNDWLVSQTGGGFGYFQLALLGGPLAIVGVGWILLAAPRTFARFTDDDQVAETTPGRFLAERIVPDGSGLVGLRLPGVEDHFRLIVHGVRRGGAHVFARRSDIVLAAGDIIVAEGDLHALDDLEREGHLDDPHPAQAGERREFVVMPESLLLGSRVGSIPSLAEHALRVVGLTSRRGRIEGSFEELQIGAGDVLVLAGDADALRQIAADCALLPLSPRRPIRVTARAGLNVALFGAGVLATAIELVPTEIGFGAVVLAMALTRSLDLRTALQDLNWSIVILLACMIPLGLAVEETGTARLAANAIAAYLPAAHPLIVAVTMLLLAVVITPFVDNVSTAVVLSPIAGGLAVRTGTPIEPLLTAVAIGASLDFLTPFGHHNNTIVMGAAGYRFSDFPRFGLPLIVLCIAVAVFMLSLMVPG